MALVEVENLSKTYGGAHAVDGVGFEIQQEEISGLPGGQSTTVNARYDLWHT